jgi:hypothetical protein
MAIDRASGYGSLSQGNFVPEIWHKKTLIKFRRNSVAWDIINRDYEGELKSKGDTVKIRQIGDLVTAAYEVGMTIQWQDLPDDLINFTVDEADYIAFKVDAVDKLQSDINIIEKYTDEMMYRLMQLFDTHVLGLHASAHADNVYGSIGSEVDCGFGTNEISPLTVMGRMSRLLDEKDVPTNGRWFVGPPIFWEQMGYESSKLMDASVTGDGKSALRNNMITSKPIRGFTCYTSNNVASNGTYYACMAGTKHAIAGAMQMTEGPKTVDIQDGFGTGVKALIVYDAQVVKSEALSTAYCKFD